MNGISRGLLPAAIACGLLLHVPAAQGNRETVLYSFCSQQDCTDGMDPFAGLIDVNGMLYGTTRYGGSGPCFGIGCGTVFSLDPATGAETVIHSFAGGNDGAISYAGLIDVNGMLYGTTSAGGSSACSGDGCGTVFAVDPTTRVETVLSRFAGNKGWFPVDRLLNVNGMLYGTTRFGGAIACRGIGCGTVFSLDPTTGTETVLHAFSGGPDGDGKDAWAGLIDSNGMLYGTTFSGGGRKCFGYQNHGTVFAVDPMTGAETVLYCFTGRGDGGDPIAGLIDVKGRLYGTTESGGSGLASGQGTVFALDPKTGRETVLYSFCRQSNCPDGRAPDAALINVQGILYGTTLGGGANGGTVFALDTKSGSLTVLYSFCSQPNCTDGQEPNSPLLHVNGKLYGTTTLGGAHGEGVVFSLSLKR